jgi:putative transcriptional regulator
MNNNLKKLRKAKGISQGDLAHQLNVSRQTINSIENGKFDPSLTLTIRLTRFFEVSLDEIFILGD